MNAKTLLVLGLAGASLISVQGAQAKTAVAPKLSGTYIVSYIETCQAVVTITTGEGLFPHSPDPVTAPVLTTISNSTNGKITHNVLSGTFVDKPAAAATNTGTVNLTGTAIQGDLWTDTTIQGGQTIAKSTATPITGSYSNTATTLIIGSNNFSIVYGPVSSNIAQSAMFTGIPNAGCAATGTAIRVGN